jgi:hypothetical protein
VGVGGARDRAFPGLSLLLGAVGLFDLRLMGYAKAIPPKALQRLVPLGVAGFKPLLQ